MNLNHLEYILAIYRAGSISKASQELFIAQSSLSTLLKNMETELGYEIFIRSSQGVSLAEKGKAFIRHASTIVQEAGKLNLDDKETLSGQFTLKLSVIRASYISFALSQLINQNYSGQKLNLFFKETNTEKVIQDVFNGDTSLGIIRFPLEHQDYYLSKLKRRGLSNQELMQYKPALIFSKKHPIAGRKQIKLADLTGFTEIIYGDIHFQELSPVNFNNESEINRIYAYDRGSMIDFLEFLPGTFIWTSCVPQSMLKQHAMVQRECLDLQYKYVDMAIFKKQAVDMPLINLLIEALLASLS